MINIQEARKTLQKYIEPYDKTNPRIALKASHIFRVADASKKIATELGLSEEQINLAELIGLLHDIGRFEQLRIYDTFEDSKSVNHAELGIKVLNENNFIYEFCKDEEYNKIIITAIKNHNKFKIEDGLNEEETLQSKIIRDADKIDIFNILRFEKFDTLYKKQDISDEKISEEILQAFLNEKQVEIKYLKTNIDDWIKIIAFIFDINFKPSFKIIKENDYINQLVDRIKIKEMEDIRKVANNYIEKNLKN